MNVTEFRLLADQDEPRDTVLDRMMPPTLDEWTRAFAELKARGDWFDQQGILQAQSSLNLQNAFCQQQCNLGMYASQQQNNQQYQTLLGMLGLQNQGGK